MLQRIEKLSGAISTGSLLLICLLFFSCSSVSAASIVLNADVAAGKWKAVKIKSLPRGTIVAVRIVSSGNLAVALGNSQSYSKLSRPLFVGQLDKELSFSVEIPKTDHYFLVLDNRKGDELRNVAITVQATHPPRPQPNPADPPMIPSQPKDRDIDL